MTNITSRLRRSLALSPLLAFLACAPSLTMEGARVKVADNAPAAKCNAISTVQGEGGSKQNAEVALRNKAGEMSANAVVVTENVENDGQVRLVGKAYTCSSDW